MKDIPFETTELLPAFPNTPVGTIYEIRPNYRLWKTEPDGPHDREVEIWFNNNWIPAFFSDIKAGDFFLELNYKLEPERCFQAASDAVPQGGGAHKYGFVIRQGSQIVTAPKYQPPKDITPELPTMDEPLGLPSPAPRLENK